MDTVVCKEVIVSTIAIRGKGERYSPLRAVTQVFEKDGTLIAEHDPCPETFTTDDLVAFAKWLREEGGNAERITTDVVNRWMDTLPGLPSFTQ